MLNLLRFYIYCIDFQQIECDLYFAFNQYMEKYICSIINVKHCTNAE